MSRDPALGRWIVIQVVRLSGIALIVTGVFGMSGRIAMPSLAAFAIAAAGLICASVFPLLLARKWRTPPQ